MSSAVGVVEILLLVTLVLVLVALVPVMVPVLFEPGTVNL